MSLKSMKEKMNFYYINAINIIFTSQEKPIIQDFRDENFQCLLDQFFILQKTNTVCEVSSHFVSDL